MKKVLNNSQLFMIGLLVVISTAFRLFYIGREPFWMDEAYTVWFTSLSFKELIFWVPSFETHPPFYYVLQKIWNESVGLIFNNSERYLSLVFSLGLFYLCPKIVRQFLPAQNPFFSSLLILIFIGFSSIISWYSIEARPYLMFMLVYALAIYGFFGLLDNNSRKFWLVFSIGVLLTNWSHSTGPLYSFILYLALATYWLGNRNRAFLKSLIFSVIFVFIFSLPLLYMILGQLAGWSAGSWIPEPSITGLYNTLNYLYLPEGIGHIPSLFLDVPFVNIIALAAKLILPLVFIYGVYLVVRMRDMKSAFLIVFSFSVPMISFVVSVFGPNIFLYRTLVPVLIPYFIFLTITISRVSSIHFRQGIFAFLLLQLCYGSYAELRYKTKEPWDQIYSYVAQFNATSDLILLFPNEVAHPFNHAGKASDVEINVKSVPFEYPAIGRTSFYPLGTPSVPGFTSTEIPVLQEMLEAKYTRIVLVTRGETMFDPDNLIQQELLGSNFNLDSTEYFVNITVYEFSRSGPKVNK